MRDQSLAALHIEDLAAGFQGLMLGCFGSHAKCAMVANVFACCAETMGQALGRWPLGNARMLKDPKTGAQRKLADVQVELHDQYGDVVVFFLASTPLVFVTGAHAVRHTQRLAPLFRETAVWHQTSCSEHCTTP